MGPCADKDVNCLHCHQKHLISAIDLKIDKIIILLSLDFKNASKETHSRSRGIWNQTKAQMLKWQGSEFLKTCFL